MKMFTLSFLCAAAATLIAAGCDPRKDHPEDSLTATSTPAAAQPAPSGPVAQIPTQLPPADLIVDLSQQVKEATFETRSTISAAFDPVNRRIEDMVAQWKLNGSQFTETAERQMQDARDNTVQKFKELGEANEETWNSARDNASSALQHLQQSINDLKESDKVKRTP